MSITNAIKSKPPELIDLYKDLPSSKNQRLKFTSSEPFTPTFVKSKLTLASNPDEIYATRVHGRKIVLENPVRESRAKKEREEKRARRKKENEKKKRGGVGKTEAKEKGLWRFDKAQAKFGLFVPLHHLWMGYMSELLGLSQRPPSSSATQPFSQSMPSASGMHPKLVKADFHGSIMTVRQSKNPSLVGVSGIVIHETENAFRVITRKDQVKLIPKANSIFAFAVPFYSTLPPSHTADTPLPIPTPSPVPGSTDGDATIITTVLDSPHLEFELYGNQFRFRSADRAGRKFKPKETIEL